MNADYGELYEDGDKLLNIVVEDIDFREYEHGVNSNTVASWYTQIAFSVLRELPYSLSGSPLHFGLCSLVFMPFFSTHALRAALFLPMFLVFLLGDL